MTIEHNGFLVTINECEKRRMFFVEVFRAPCPPVFLYGVQFLKDERHGPCNAEDVAERMRQLIDATKGELASGKAR